MVLTKAQTHRSIEQNREYRRGSHINMVNCFSTLQKQFSGEQIVFSTNSVGTIGHSHAKINKYATRESLHTAMKTQRSQK